MKINKRSSVCSLLVVAFGSLFAQQVSITQSCVTLESDSVRIVLKMNVNSFFVSSDEAVIFTPVLKEGSQAVDLPPVIVSGKKQMTLYKREHALKLGESAKPYVILLRNKKEHVRPVQYKVNVPYASWMNKAALCVRSEYRDCCTKQYLSFTTLLPVIDLKGIPTPTEEPSIIGDTIPPIEESAVVNEKQPSSKKEPVTDAVRINYPLGRFDVTVSNKPLLASLIRDRQADIEQIGIVSYASPEGAYGENERLARQRAENVRNYICKVFGVDPLLVKTQWVAENWDGLIELLQYSDKPYREGVISLISHYGIFSGREKRLMDYRGGTPYREMAQELFPQLRYTIIQIKYRSK